MSETKTRGAHRRAVEARRALRRLGAGIAEAVNASVAGPVPISWGGFVQHLLGGAGFYNPGSPRAIGAALAALELDQLARVSVTRTSRFVPWEVGGTYRHEWTVVFADAADASAVTAVTAEMRRGTLRSRVFGGGGTVFIAPSGPTTLVVGYEQ